MQDKQHTSDLKLTVSLIFHASYTYLTGALKSLYETTHIPFEVYVVVNTGQGRDDPQVDKLLAEYPDIKLIINEKPLGFAANHNQVMAQASTPYVALLNDDIILHAAALDILVDYLDQHPQVGLVGPQQYNPDGTYQVAVYDDPSLFRMIYKISGLATLTHERSPIRNFIQWSGLATLIGVESLKIQKNTHAVDVIKGVVMMVRREAYHQVGLMDEATIVYGEEADWHLRLRQAGWGVVFVAESAVTHFGLGQAKLQLKGQLLVEDRRSILNYFIKYRPRWQVFLIRAAIVIFHGLWGLVWLPFNRERARVHLRVVQIGWGK